MLIRLLSMPSDSPREGARTQPREMVAPAVRKRSVSMSASGYRRKQNARSRADEQPSAHLPLAVRGSGPEGDRLWASRRPGGRAGQERLPGRWPARYRDPPPVRSVVARAVLHQGWTHVDARIPRPRGSSGRRVARGLRRGTWGPWGRSPSYRGALLEFPPLFRERLARRFGAEAIGRSSHGVDARFSFHGRFPGVRRDA